MTDSTRAARGQTWPAHYARAGTHIWAKDEEPEFPGAQSRHLQPWLSALLQAEHVNLLLGSGLTMAIGTAVKVKPVGMGTVKFDGRLGAAIEKAAEKAATRSARGEPNFEDQVRVVGELLGGLRILELGGDPEASILRSEWQNALDASLQSFRQKVLLTEQRIRDAFDQGDQDGRRLLSSFLLAFASRPGTRERLHIFTTNYDRLIEFGCDSLGLRILDRFVGRLAPVFHSSRLAVDLHYNPPGLRGEPRYLDGVVRLTKLHGSLDWHRRDAPPGGPEIVQSPLPFGADATDANSSSQAVDNLMIYPNAAKDSETLEYPYADLFRDFAAAICRPNAVLVTYGYGFGDDHVNRMLRDMLTIPSTHLVIISYEDTGNRAQRFVTANTREQQVTVLLGGHFGNLPVLVEHYLPKPYIDRNIGRMVEIQKRREPSPQDGECEPGNESDTRVET